MKIITGLTMHHGKNWWRIEGLVGRGVNIDFMADFLTNLGYFCKMTQNIFQVQLIMLKYNVPWWFLHLFDPISCLKHIISEQFIEKSPFLLCLQR